jgi:hypothetical protein
MGIVDNEKFKAFVESSLPTDQMIQVKDELLSADEGEAVMMACQMIDPSDYGNSQGIFAVDADDDEIFFEKNNRKDDRIGARFNYMNMRKQKNNLNSIVMKTKLTNEQIHLIEQNVNDFSNLEDKDKSLEANLAAYYMSRVPDVTHDEAMEIVSRLKNGITTFNTNLANALKMEEVDYSEMIERVMQTEQISNKSLIEQYEVLVNILSMLHSIEADNFSMENLTHYHSFAEIKDKYIKTTGEVSEEDIDSVKELINETLQNSSFCLGTIDRIRELIDQTAEDPETVVGIVYDQKSDIRMKLIQSMATYVAVVKGDILDSTFSAEKATPEMIAVGVAAGVEEQRVIVDLGSGKCDQSLAVRIIKIIGGVALATLMLFGVIASTFIVATGIVDAVVAAMGVGFFAMLTASVLSSLVGMALIVAGIMSIGYVLYAAGDLFDTTEEALREVVWPKIKEVAIKFYKWVRNLFGGVTASDIVASVSSVPLISQTAKARSVQRAVIRN